MIDGLKSRICRQKSRCLSVLFPAEVCAQLCDPVEVRDGLGGWFKRSRCVFPARIFVSKGLSSSLPRWLKSAPLQLLGTAAFLVTRRSGLVQSHCTWLKHIRDFCVSSDLYFKVIRQESEEETQRTTDVILSKKKTWRVTRLYLNLLYLNPHIKDPFVHFFAQFSTETRKVTNSSRKLKQN